MSGRTKLMCVRPLVDSSGDVQLTWPDSVKECRHYKYFGQFTQIQDSPLHGLTSSNWSILG